MIQFYFHHPCFLSSFQMRKKNLLRIFYGFNYVHIVKFQRCERKVYMQGEISKIWRIIIQKIHNYTTTTLIKSKFLSKITTASERTHTCTNGHIRLQCFEPLNIELVIRLKTLTKYSIPKIIQCAQNEFRIISSNTIDISSVVSRISAFNELIGSLYA